MLKCCDKLYAFIMSYVNSERCKHCIYCEGDSRSHDNNTDEWNTVMKEKVWDESRSGRTGPRKYESSDWGLERLKSFAVWEPRHYFPIVCEGEGGLLYLSVNVSEQKKYMMVSKECVYIQMSFEWTYKWPCAFIFLSIFLSSSTLLPSP